MEDLIKALQIMVKHHDGSKHPTYVEESELRINGVDPEDFSDKEKKNLESLGFEVDYTDGCFYSFRYGSVPHDKD